MRWYKVLTRTGQDGAEITLAQTLTDHGEDIGSNGRKRLWNVQFLWLIFLKF